MFGLYQSHGALLVANSEDDLKHHDVKNGWDWTRIPGTTSIGFNFNGLRTKGDRRYNKRALAGGVTFSGRSTYSLSTLNGIAKKHIRHCFKIKLLGRQGERAASLIVVVSKEESVGAIETKIAVLQSTDVIPEMIKHPLTGLQTWPA